MLLTDGHISLDSLFRMSIVETPASSYEHFVETPASLFRMSIVETPASPHLEDFLGIWDDTAPIRSQQWLASGFLITSLSFSLGPSESS